jgi:hypothetical protein
MATLMGAWIAWTTCHVLFDLQDTVYPYRAPSQNVVSFFFKNLFPFYGILFLFLYILCLYLIVVRVELR